MAPILWEFQFVTGAFKLSQNSVVFLRTIGLWEMSSGTVWGVTKDVGVPVRVVGEVLLGVEGGGAERGQVAVEGVGVVVGLHSVCVFFLFVRKNKCIVV